jgi:hypothetical protein
LIFAHDSLITLYADARKLFIGTAKSGVLEFADGKVKPLGILQNNAIREIGGTAEKGLWFAAEKGLFLWQNTAIKAVIENMEFRSVLVKDDKIYAGSLNKGLFEIKFDDEFGWIFSNLNVEQGLPSSRNRQRRFKVSNKQHFTRNFAEQNYQRAGSQHQRNQRRHQIGLSAKHTEC